MKTLITLCALSLLSVGCDKSENFSLLPADNRLVGVWEEREPAGIAQFEGSTFVSLNLQADNNFTLTIRKWTDIMDHNNPCMAVSDYYIKGTYTVSGNTIAMNGCYSDAAFRDCIPACDGQADYSETVQYEFDGEILILDPDADVIVKRVMVSRS